MPNIQNSIRTLTLADATVSGLVGTRMYSSILPQNPTLPAIVSILVDDIPFEHLTGIVNVSQARIQMDCYAATTTAANTLGDAVRLALEKKHRGDDGAGQFINEINLLTGPHSGVDAPVDGSQNWRFISILDFQVTYRTTTS